jgi:hypothetical protein
MATSPYDKIVNGLQGISPKGHNYRVTGTTIIYNTPEKWNADKQMYVRQCYVYLHFPEQKQRVRLKFDYDDSIIERLNWEDYSKLEKNM